MHAKRLGTIATTISREPRFDSGQTSSQMQSQQRGNDMAIDTIEAALDEIGLTRLVTAGRIHKRSGERFWMTKKGARS